MNIVIKIILSNTLLFVEISSFNNKNKVQKKLYVSIFGFDNFMKTV